jgi:hypothetical protein
MQIGHARDHRTGETLGTVGGHSRLDPRQAAIGGELDADVLGPAAGKPGGGREQRRRGGFATHPELRLDAGR